jgi:hypothetical protein
MTSLPLPPMTFGEWIIYDEITRELCELLLPEMARECEVRAVGQN